MTLRIYCPSCSGEIRNDSGLCPTCGVTIHSLENDQTRPFESGKSPSARTSQKAISYDSIDDARFVPGAILADRYRIVGLLGKGGMGEVYRADDLKLGQSVALKFLPEHLLSDGAALARFHREVRVARQVSHKNVCRVYDIGETDGRHFLSMEYIKGEELSSLLRRIGRLPIDKATQLARQICAGLNAAHDVGVLHRDLKPSNVMIDGDGNARILDFGLAGLSEDFADEELAAGTPAYMAPEQIERGAITERSDIYSLGLLLYELFTSKRAFDAPTLDELILLRLSNTAPLTPTSIVKDLDPVIERVIDRCLKTDPRQRPSSALQVAASLPGGDPIAAALAAGETPSPEMVAAAPQRGTLRPAVAISLLGSIVFFIAVAMLLSKYSAVHRIIPFQKSPELLKEQASQLATSFGYTAAPTDKASGFDIDFEYFRHLELGALDPWEALKSPQPPLIRFWYRQSPGFLVPFSQQAITFSDPPMVPGMLQMRLDTEGKLNYFEAAPDQAPEGTIVANTGQAQTSNSSDDTEVWSNLFRAAGLDINNFQPTESLWAPPRAYDSRRAWLGSGPNLKEPIRVEAAAFGSRPVYFTIINPWSKPVPELTSVGSLGQKFFVWTLFGLFFGIMLLGVFLAWKNLRLGRGDRRGAFRVTLFVFIARLLLWGVATHHVADNAEVLLLVTGIQSALFWSCFVGVMYLALEPYLRRRWPERIISWNRLLAGDFRDPLIGRDILIGLAIGAFIVAMMTVRVALPRWFTSLHGMPDVNDGFEAGVVGVSAFGTILISQVTASMVQTFMVVFLLLFLTLLFRKQWLAIAVGWLILFGLLMSPEFARSHWIRLACIGVVVGAIVFCAVRFGPVALMSTIFMMHLWVFYPMTTEFRIWYASSFLLITALILALAGYSFYVSLGGQKVFTGRLLHDE